jgi:hypothetical protein
MSFRPEFADAIESGEMFFCTDCNDYIAEDATFCPWCHVGVCEICSEPVAADSVGWRNPSEPAQMNCKRCEDHQNGVPGAQAAPTVSNLLSEMQRLADRKSELKPHEKVLLWALK